MNRHLASLAFGTAFVLSASTAVFAIKPPPGAKAQIPLQRTRPASPQEDDDGHHHEAPAPKAPKHGPAVTGQTLSDAILAGAMDRLAAQGDAHFHKGEFSHVINVSRILVQADPKDVESYSNAAYLLWSTDRFDEGTELLKQGLKAMPDSYWMYDELGKHFSVRTRNYKAAIPYYEKAAKFQCPAATLHGLANCYEKLSMWDKSVKVWERAAKDKKDLLAQTRLSRAKVELAKRKGNR